ncbi:MAG: glycosyltransferase [Bacteroidia bacterium]
MIDIITVTYNSEKWLSGYFNGLLAQKGFDLKKVNLIFLDNNSTDQTVNSLLDCKSKYERYLHGIVVVPSKINLGFGRGNNEGFKHSRFDHILFLNADVYLQTDNLQILESEIAKKDNRVGAWELRQMPYEHPKYYHPVSLETSWASAAAIMIRKDIFTAIEGFDPNFFMYCEDVDISWKIRMEDRSIKYLPNCCFYHYTYPVINEIKETAYLYGILNNLFLRIKFGNKKDVSDWITLFRGVLKNKGPFENSRKKLLKVVLKNLHYLIPLYLWKVKNKKKIALHSPKKFLGFDYEITRGAGFYYTQLPKITPLVSVLVRTCNRPDVLRRTLLSLRNQTYRHFEVVIVEDGPNGAEKMLKTEFYDLNINYHATKTKLGRCIAGNLAMERSKGKFLCFLDDDDYFYPDYLETMVSQFERNPDLYMANSLSFLAEIDTKSMSPYIYEVKKTQMQNSPIFNLLLLVRDNFYPIQCIMFRRTVFEELGGFNVEVDYSEDWLLWLTYTSKYHMYSILKVCSIFKVPFDEETKRLRQINFEKHRNIAHTYIRNLQLNINLYNLSELQKLS